MSLAALSKIERLRKLKSNRKKKKKKKKLKSIDLTVYCDRPIDFFREVLGIEIITSEQEEIVTNVMTGQTTNVQAAHGVGKCLAQNEPVLLANGLEVKACNLVGVDFNLITLDNGITRVVKAKADWNQVEEVYEITTETGRRIIRNGKHPLWVGVKWSRNGAHPIIDVKEWTAIDQIKTWLESPPEYIPSKFSRKDWNIKDRKHSIICAVPEEIPVFGDKPLPEHEIKIMAYLIGDGGLTTTTPVFTQQDNKQLAEFKQSVETMGCVLSRRSDISYAVINPIENRYFPKQKPISRALHELKDFSCDLAEGEALRDRHISTKKAMESLGHKPNKFYQGLKVIKVKPVAFYGKAYISLSQFKLYKSFSNCLIESRKFKISGSSKGNLKKAIEIFNEKYQGTITEQVSIKLLEEQKESAIRIVEARQGIEPGKCRDFITPNKVKELLRKHDLLEKGSADKIIPDAIFQLPKEQLAIFLSRLFSTDGWACVSTIQEREKHGKAEIGFCSISRQLIEQIQRLLLRFGIVANILPKPKVNAWVLYIHRSEMILRFADKIGIFGKEEAVTGVVERAKIANSSKQKQSWRNKNAPDGTTWEKIVSIKKLDDPELTVAVEVPGYHHYLTNFWEHNSYITASIILWWVFSVEGMAVSTAPTHNQVRDILWKEVRALYDRNKKKLGGSRTELGIKKKTVEGKIVVGFGKASRNYDSNSFQGLHDKKLLLAQDEADGITPTIDEAFEACLTGSENRAVRIGNPLSPNSAFAKNCSASSIKIPVWNHPNVKPYYEEVIAENGKPIHRLKPEIAERILKPVAERKDDPVKPQDQWDDDLPRDVIPGAVSVAWIEKVRAKYGEHSVYWDTRVEAEFPTDSIEGIIPLSWLHEARERYDRDPDYWDDLAKEDKWRIGADVGDGGDQHAVAALRGKVLYKVTTYPTTGDRLDTIRLAQKIIEPFVNQLGADYAIAVDRLGVGAGTLGTLMTDGYTSFGCVFGGSAEDNVQFKNRKIELYWGFREGLRLGEIAIAPLGEIEEEVFEDLSAVRYFLNTEKQLCCEPKEATRVRLGRSPDAGDSVIIAQEIKPLVVIEQTLSTNTAIDREEREYRELLNQDDEFSIIDKLAGF